MIYAKLLITAKNDEDASSIDEFLALSHDIERELNGVGAWTPVPGTFGQMRTEIEVTATARAMVDTISRIAEVAHSIKTLHMQELDGEQLELFG